MGYAQAMERLRRAILLVSDPDLGADIWMALFNTNHLAKLRLRLTRRGPAWIGGRLFCRSEAEPERAFGAVPSAREALRYVARVVISRILRGLRLRLSRVYTDIT